MIEVKGQLHKHKYNPENKRWERIGKPSANVAPVPTAPNNNTTNTNNTQDEATRRTALANMQQQMTQMNQTFTAFMRDG